MECTVSKIVKWVLEIHVPVRDYHHNKATSSAVELYETQQISRSIYWYMVNVDVYF